MKVASGLVLVAVMFVILYLAITGKLDCFAGAFRCAFLNAGQPGQQQAPAATRPTSGVTVKRGGIVTV